jgi:RNA polymerase sigma factor (sigma-70 family)
MSSADQFEALVCEHYEPLFRFAMSLTRSESDAWDLTQHTFYVWATKGHQLHDPSKARTWLFTTLHRAFLAARRTRVRFPHHDLEEVSQQLPAHSPNLADQLDSAQVLSALARVDEIYQAAVALFYLDDCSYKEIAEILGVPMGTVKSRIARGIIQLRRLLVSDGVRAPAPDEDGSSLAPVADEPAARGNIPSAVHPEAPGRNAERWDMEWDLGSTRLLEPFCAA